MITSLLSRHSFLHDTEISFTELNLRKKKWLICCCYNPPKNLINYHLQELAKGIQMYSNNYDDILLMGNFNADISETSFPYFCEHYEVKRIINQSTCYKNPTNPSCIDLFLTNSRSSFQKSTVVKTDLSAFYKLDVTVMKSYSPMRTPNLATYRKYTNFDKDKFLDEMSFNLQKHNLLDIALKAFIRMFKFIFEKHAPLKKKYLRAFKFVTKELSEAIRSKLRKRLLKDRKEESRREYKKQRNVCVYLFKKTEKDYYENIDISNLTDSKKFWKTLKPIFGSKKM